MTSVLRKQNGFTILEMVMTVAISLVIAYSIFAVARSGQDQIQTSHIRMTIQDSAREGLYKMTQELRLSAPSRIAIGNGGNVITFTVPNPNNSFAADFSVNWAGAQSIRYALGGTNNRQLIRTNQTTGQTSIIANDVASILFQGNGANPSLITITMNVQRALTNTRFIPQTPLQLTGQAEVRNV